MSTAVLQKHLNDELKLVCLVQLFPQVAENSISLPCSKKSVRIAGLCHAVLDSAIWCLATAFSALTLLVPAHLGSPGHRAVKRVCVCIWCLARPEVGPHRWLSSFYSPTLHRIPGVFSVFREIPENSRSVATPTVSARWSVDLSADSRALRRRTDGLHIVGLLTTLVTRRTLQHTRPTINTLLCHRRTAFAAVATTIASNGLFSRTTC